VAPVRVWPRQLPAGAQQALMGLAAWQAARTGR